MADTGPFSDSWREGFRPLADPGSAFAGLFDRKGHAKPDSPPMLYPPEPLTKDKIKLARKAMGLSGAKLAICLGVSHRTIQEWERRQRRNDPPPYLRYALIELERRFRRGLD